MKLDFIPLELAYITKYSIYYEGIVIPKIWSQNIWLKSCL